MDVEIKLEPGRTAPKVIILTGEMTDQVTDLARRLTAGESRFLPGRQGDPPKEQPCRPLLPGAARL